ncbi:hypothetical protein DY000_02010971 [Brassica cretica]|uniref:FBD domain-containing protein n=1 Tax=Brassica cretica TaxID=69181 RepID=A0ABQ7CQB7_BRACR|nr:hypothetical protein DY000_02010971 [Brassica cretica]
MEMSSSGDLVFDLSKSMIESNGFGFNGEKEKLTQSNGFKPERLVPDLITCRSSRLKSLRLIMFYPIADEGFVEAVRKLPLLEYLEVTYSSLSGESLIIVGQSCPNLKTLRLNSEPDPKFYDEECNDEEALGIAESMPELCHLQLFGNILTNTGLTAILDGYPHREHLDLRKCFNVRLEGDLEKRCSERIKDLKRTWKNKCNLLGVGYLLSNFAIVIYTIQPPKHHLKALERVAEPTQERLPPSFKSGRLQEPVTTLNEDEPMDQYVATECLAVVPHSRIPATLRPGNSGKKNQSRKGKTVPIASSSKIVTKRKVARGPL